MKSPRARRTEVLSLLGLAMRAGAVASGTDAARRAVREGRARLVILAEDAAPGQHRKVLSLLRHRSVPCATLADRAGLGAAVGGPPLSAVAVTDASFAEQVLRRLRKGDGEVENLGGTEDACGLPN